RRATRRCPVPHDCRLRVRCVRTRPARVSGSVASAARERAGVRLDLETLRQLHPKLSVETASGYAHCAAIALQRHHTPGVSAAVNADAERSDATILWTVRPAEDAEQKDAKRVTEDGAEAVALALVKHAWGWTVSRRLQQGESADWLMIDEASHK